MTTLKEEVLRKYQSDYFFETGTSDGCGVELALKFNFEKIFSIEIDETLYLQNVKKFEKEIEDGKVVLFLGDTVTIMDDILEKYIDKKTTFWLDAHVDNGPMGTKKCPLYEEIESIERNKIKNHTILIDDIRCFGGGWWGEGISLTELQSKIADINSNYFFIKEDGYVEEDVLAACVDEWDSFENALTNNLRKIKNVKGIIQIGANIGQEVKILELFSNNIVLVEPLPYCQKILKEKYTKHLTIPFAVGTNEMVTKFYVANNGGASSSLLEPKLHKRVFKDVEFFTELDVEVKKFTNIIEQYNLKIEEYNVLLIDAQGSDLDCIKSFESKLNNFDLIICEVIDIELYHKNPNLIQYISYLENYNFELSELHGYDGKVGNCFFKKIN